MIDSTDSSQPQSPSPVRPTLTKGEKVLCIILLVGIVVTIIISPMLLIRDGRRRKWEARKAQRARIDGGDLRTRLRLGAEADQRWLETENWTREDAERVRAENGGGGDWNMGPRLLLSPLPPFVAQQRRSRVYVMDDWGSERREAVAANPLPAYVDRGDARSISNHRGNADTRARRERNRLPLQRVSAHGNVSSGKGAERGAELPVYVSEEHAVGAQSSFGEEIPAPPPPVYRRDYNPCVNLRRMKMCRENV